MPVEYCIVSIGTLSHNHLWNESGAVRTSHATTTLVSDDKRLILVDPSLPAQVLSARFNERTGKQFADVTDVFCTTLRPVHRRAIAACSHATWWASEVEITGQKEYLQQVLESAERLKSDEVKLVEAELKLLDRFKPAPEKFSPQVHLYPLPGPSMGNAGLLLTPAVHTILIAGDAALTGEHVQRGQVWEGCSDRDAAMESLKDILEIADIIVPGHDNVMFSPQRGL